MSSKTSTRRVLTKYYLAIRKMKCFLCTVSVNDVTAALLFIASDLNIFCTQSQVLSLRSTFGFALFMTGPAFRSSIIYLPELENVPSTDDVTRTL